MPTTVRSFSKINLGLAVGPARSDGFHGLTTLYQTLDLHDVVSVQARPAETGTITLDCTKKGATLTDVPQTGSGDAEKNTAWRMVAAALTAMRAAGLISGEFAVEIHIDKRLPVQGGMGAGSANAAAALLALEREVGAALAPDERLALAANIGSDVPLFLLGGAVLGLGRGEQVFPLPDFPRIPCVIALPAVGVSTAAAFRELDARGGLTFQQAEGRLEKLSRVFAGVFTTSGRRSGPSGIAGTATSDTGSNIPFDSTAKGEGAALDLAEMQGPERVCPPADHEVFLALVRTGVENDFEDVAFSLHPSLRDIKRALLGSRPGKLDSPPCAGESGCLWAALSGSGSALFGLYGSQHAAEAAQQRVRETGVDALLSETLPRTAYWERMFAE